MTTINLDGKWTLHDEYTQKEYEATVPGLDLGDLISHGVLPDIQQCESDEVYFKMSDFDRSYKRTFTVTKAMLKEEKAILHFDRLDTLSEVYINGIMIAETHNIHLQYNFDIRPCIKEGENEIEVKFLSLRRHIRDKQKTLKLPWNSNGTVGHPHIRKCGCHFGWDFGPELDAQGISGHCEIKLYSHGVIDFFEVKQQVNKGTGTIECSFTLENSGEGENLSVVMTSPDGKEKTYKVPEGENALTITVDNPELWWCSGYGEQPLYTLKAVLKKGRKILSEKTKRIGFRTISLDRRKDKYGTNFCFVLNGKPIFAKGANYIPMDGLYTNITSERLYNLLSSCKEANMNMLRVWGGGFYESDEFYDMCDELGILLWQDFAFACCGYPFMREDFLKSALQEIEQNVPRLKHHACLALWCGNNEIESMSMAWLPMTSFINSAGDFFYKKLPELLEKLDGITPYHPTSPSSGEYMKNMNSDKYGDTHLWNVWHGYEDKNFWKTRKTRFCSEFGMQSYPHTSLKPHQKCDMGEERLRYYLTKHFALSGKEDYKVYFTQLLQMEYMKEAVEHFRRIGDICHGTLYWQLNDIWAGASWAGIDFGANKKALMYHSKHFYEQIHISATQEKDRINVYITSESGDNFTGTAVLKTLSLSDGNEKENILEVYIPANKTKEIFSFEKKKFNKTNDVLVMSLYDEKGNIISENNKIFCENKDLALKPSNIGYTVSAEGDTAEITLTADSYARYVFLDIEGETNAFSDNFFDLYENESKTVSIKVKDADNIPGRLTITTLYDAMEGADKAKDMLIYAREYTRPMALGNRVSRWFEI